MAEFELTLNSPITDEQWDAITDVDFDNTDRIWFQTKHGKTVEFIKAHRTPITNADRIRAMSDEELADYHAKMQLLGEYGVDSEKTELCKKLWLDWLQSPAGGDTE